MAQQIINTGAVANDGTGDPLRTAFTETNNNFTEIYTAGPVDSNVRIVDNTILTLNTNGNLVLAPNGTGVVQSNVSIVPNQANVRNLGGSARRWSTLYLQYADISNTVTIGGGLTVGGNLTVSGNIIQVGNIITDSLTIQLGNTAATANAANGAGVTVGANDNIATVLYNSTSNVWTTNIGLSAVGNISGANIRTTGTVSATGNVTGNYFIGNGSQLTGIASSYGNSNVTTLLSNLGSNVISGTGNITTTANISGGYILGNGSQLTGLAATYGNANVATFLAAFGSNTIVTTGNITAGNVLTSAEVIANGVIQTGTGFSTGGYLSVNGSTDLHDTNIIGTLSVNTIRSDDSTIVLIQDGVEVDGDAVVNGDVTADTFIGTGNLHLQPDPTNSGSYLDIYLTGGPDIHIASNDNSIVIGRDTGANVFVGNDGEVSIRTDDGVTAQVWNFTDTGNLTAPGNVSAVGNVTGAYVKGNGSELTNLPAPVVTQDITSTGDMSIMTYDGVIKSVNYATVEPSSGNIKGGNITTTGLVSATGNITAGNVSTGVITLTNGAVIKDNAGDSVAFGQGAGNTTQGQQAVAIGLQAGFASQGNYAVAIGKFSANSSQGEYAVAVGPNAGFENQSSNAVSIGSTAGASSQGINSVAIGVGAAYNTQGNSAVAVGNSAGYLLQGINSVAIGNLAGFAFQGVNSIAIGRLAGNTSQGNNSIILNATGAVLDQTTANTFTVSPVRNDVANTGQVVFYNTSSKEITYGNVINVAGNITGGNLITAGSGGAITMTGGNITGAGNISATGNVTGGNVLTGGVISSTGNITGGNISATNHTGTTVSVTGNITAANFFGNGNTLSNVATRFESSWIVPVGNSTQSFTVTAGETYYLWVDCNITNGILAWNATATVTNTNVPVVGAQYAWVYNGGGTPIDFTSIPGQFVGTANTILRSNVAPSSTTNRFDFGINNTSGGNATVRYGWVAIS